MTGLAKPLKLSPELKDLLGTNLDMMPRMQAINTLYDYIKKNDLHDPKQRQFFIPDPKMQPIFGTEPVKIFGLAKFLKGHLGDKPSRPTYAGKASAALKKNKVSVGQVEGVSDYEKMRRANIKERQEGFAKTFLVGGNKAATSKKTVTVSDTSHDDDHSTSDISHDDDDPKSDTSHDDDPPTSDTSHDDDHSTSDTSHDDSDSDYSPSASGIKKQKSSQVNKVSRGKRNKKQLGMNEESDDDIPIARRKKPYVQDSDVPLAKMEKRTKKRKAAEIDEEDKDLPMKPPNKKTKKPQNKKLKDRQLWEGFIIFSQFKVTNNGRHNHKWIFNKKSSWNPYTASLKEVSMFQQILNSRNDLSEEDLDISLNAILHYLPDLMGKELPEIHIEENVYFLLNLINKDKPFGYSTSYYPNLKRYNGDIWDNFVIYYDNHVKEDPFLAMPHHVKDFIMELFEKPQLPSLLLENYPDFYCGNVVNICKNLGFFLKFEYDEKSLLESKPIQDILNIYYSLDQKLYEPAGKCSKKDSDFQTMIPKYWYVNSRSPCLPKNFWKQGLVRNILMDVKNKVLKEGEAAWELGATIDMVSCAVQKMEPDKEFRELTVKEYVEQGFGSEDTFWKESSTKMLLDDLKNRVKGVDVDTVAFQLGTSSATVLEKTGRIKTWLEIEEEKHKMRLEKNAEKIANAPPKLSPLEFQIHSAEKNKDSMSDYEKLRLRNMKEKLALLNSLDIEKDKKSLKSITPLRPNVKYSVLVEPRKQPSRVKTLSKKKESLKVGAYGVEESIIKEHDRNSPLWVGRRTPKNTVDPVDLDSHLCWELVEKSNTRQDDLSWFGQHFKSDNQLSPEDLSAIIPVPKLTIGATELISSELEYYKGERFLHRLGSEIEICGSGEKLQKDINIGNWIQEGGGKVSNDEIISMAMSEELVAFGDMGGGLGFWLGEKHLLLRPHNMPVCSTFFTGSGSSTSVVTASHDGTVRVFDASKQEFSLAYSWNKRYKYKQGVVWLEPVDQNLWLVNCEEGDLLNLDKRDRKVNKILSLPNSRRSCLSHNLISPKEYSRNSLRCEDGGVYVTPALFGSNIAIHPKDSNLISLCDDKTVLVYDRRNVQKPISTISTSSKFDGSNSVNSTLSHHCGSSWSLSGKHFVTCERNSNTYKRKSNEIMQGSFNLYLNAQLTDNDLVAKKINSKLNIQSQIFTSGQGIVWSPWQDDVFYFMANRNRNGMVMAVDVNSGDVIGKFDLPTQASNMMGFHPTRPQLVVANLNETGDVIIYKEHQIAE